MKSAVWIIVMLFIHDAASLKTKSTHVKKHNSPRSTHKRRKLTGEPATSPAVSYKYSSTNRSTLQAVSLLLIVILIVMLLASESSTGIGRGGSIDKIALWAGAGALLTHMMSNTKQLRNRRLKLTQKRKALQATVRKLFSIDGMGSLYGNLLKLVKKNGIGKINTKKPDMLFGFVKRVLKSKLGLKGPVVEQAIDLAKNFLGFAF